MLPSPTNDSRQVGRDWRIARRLVVYEVRHFAAGHGREALFITSTVQARSGHAQPSAHFSFIIIPGRLVSLLDV